jgi:hypothetical protein
MQIAGRGNLMGFAGKDKGSSVTPQYKGDKTHLN